MVVGLITVILSSLTKSIKSEFSMLINICGGLIIFFLILSNLTELFAGIEFLGEGSGVSSTLIAALLKVIGVGYITEFCADIAEDNGNKFVASKVILGGKIAICVMAFPIVKHLFQTIISLI